MDDVALMAVKKRIDDLRDIMSGHGLFKVSLSMKMLEELALGGIFENQMHMCVVVEIAIQLENVWMVETRLDLNFPLQIADPAALDKHRLEKNFECNCDIRKLFFC